MTTETLLLTVYLGAMPLIVFVVAIGEGAGWYDRREWVSNREAPIFFILWPVVIAVIMLFVVIAAIETVGHIVGKIAGGRMSRKQTDD